MLVVVIRNDKTSGILRIMQQSRSISEWKSLHLEKLKGDRSEFYSVRLNDQFRLLFKLNTTTVPTSIEVYSIEDYHKDRRKK